jgi:hypothetical protein
MDLKEGLLKHVIRGLPVPGEPDEKPQQVVVVP